MNDLMKKYEEFNAGCKMLDGESLSSFRVRKRIFLADRDAWWAENHLQVKREISKRKSEIATEIRNTLAEIR